MEWDVEALPLKDVSNTRILEDEALEDGEKELEVQSYEDVLVLINNLSMSNVEEKVADLKSILANENGEFRKWLAHYLVGKRITKEQNFHPPYNSLLNYVNDSLLNRYIKDETLRNIKIILKSEKKHDASSYDDRQLLKNLGNWLGLITIARNQPLIVDELNMRDLVIEAFFKGHHELVYVIPFISKVLKASKLSIIFSPTCPWIRQILRALAEIHQQSDLKVALKYEIEVLCKELDVNISSLIEDNETLLADVQIDRVTEQLSHVTSHSRPVDTYRNDLVGGPCIPRSSALSKFFLRVEAVFREWMNICTPDIHLINDLAPQLFTLLRHYEICNKEKDICKLIKTCLDICTDGAYRLLSRDEDFQMSQSLKVRNHCYYTIDAFSKLACALVRNAEMIADTTKLQLLQRILDLLTATLLNDHENKPNEFHGLPFLRIFITIFKDLCSSDKVVSSLRWHVIEYFGHALRNIQPRRAPAFSFHWLEIVGSRIFITELLAFPNAPIFACALYTQLVLACLKFIAPCLRNVNIPKAVEDLYKGVLRILVVLLHDFPGLLCDYYHVFCDVIPLNCIQIRNLVLSAYPSTVILPDPFGQQFASLVVLPEMYILAKVPFEMFHFIPKTFRASLDAFLNTRCDVIFLTNFASKFKNKNGRMGSKYNIPMLNAVVNYVGVKAIADLEKNSIRLTTTNITHTAYMDIFENLAVMFDNEGRYLLFNAMCNHLRYPNAQTHYFARTLLHLFENSASNLIREQITRVLFERMISAGPHPWGVLITFRELVRNENYKFWSYDFIAEAPELQKYVSPCQSKDSDMM